MRRAFIALVLAVAACSSAASPTTAPVNAPTPTTPSTSVPRLATTSVSSTTSVPPPTTVRVGEPVGDAAALRLLAADAARESGIALDDIPVPDLTHPDPATALREMLVYSEWVYAVHPHPALAAIHTMAGSPARESEELTMAQYRDNGWISVHEPYRTWNFNEISVDVLPMTDEEKEALPPEARAFQFQSTGSGAEIIERRTGEVALTVEPWVNRLFVIAIVPTEVGWQEYWFGTVGGG